MTVESASEAEHPVPTRRGPKPDELSEGLAALAPLQSLFAPGMTPASMTSRLRNGRKAGRIVPGARFINQTRVEGGVEGTRCWRTD